MGRLLLLLERARTSLWLVPVGVSLLGAGLAAIALSTDLRLARAGVSLWWLYSGGATDAANLLATLATAIITLTTLAISITMVVLTLAANQLGPRLIRSFMDDRGAQLALGVFVGTIVYLLLVLRAVNGQMSAADLPRLAITGGSALTLTCVLVLLLFVHHLASSIIADTVVRRVGARLDQAVADHWRANGDEIAIPGALDPPPGSRVVGLRGSGYVQTVDHEELLRAAADAGATLRLSFRPGHHLLRGGPHVMVTPATAVAEALRERICRSVVLGPERTPVQDVEFAARQLVEVALRALSPGINDPFTAIAAIDRLSVSISLVPPAREGPGILADRKGAPRVLYPRVDFAGLLDTAFNQIRQAAQHKPDVLIAMLDGLGALAATERTEIQRTAILRHVATIGAAGRRSTKEPQDLAAIEAREQRVQALLADSGSMRLEDAQPLG